MSLSAEKIVQHIHTVNARRDLAAKMGRLDDVMMLQAWQCRRLLTTHADLRAEPTFADAMQFFVDELYGPKDFSQRDKDLTRVIPKLAAVLPEKALKALDDALRLNALSFDLDLDMVNALLSLNNEETLTADAITADTYAQAYRQVGRPEQRAEQIDIVEQLGLQLADVVHVRGISLLIKMARKPAEIAGVLALHEFLAQGFAAFKQLGDVRAFLDPIVSRERAIMTALFQDDFSLQQNPLPQELRE
ncbi:FFLEELY motif protein [Alteromonas facilis]|uniref:FFLEELY motif protein n=1 Tax=Alteromonas facilis TaxID=2048004 RepID=UPI000C28D700|nr:hypothetical protein [Alteromonas facilis]